MMVRILPILVVLFLGHAAADDLDACSAGCVSSVFADASTYSCAQNDKLCVCNSGTTYQNGIRDCITQACGLSGDALTAQVTLAQASAQTQCAALSATASATSATTAATAASEATTTTTPVTTTAAAETPTSTSLASTTTAATPATTASEGTTAVSSAASTLQTSTLSTAKGNVVTSSSTTGTSAAAQATGSGTGSTTASSSNSADSDSGSDSDSDSGGLSVGAKAGIGAGVGVAVILSGIIFCCLMAKKRKTTQQQQQQSRIPTMQISKPMAGSGRQYAADVETTTKVPYLSTYFRDDRPADITPARYSAGAASSQYSPTRSAYNIPTRPSREDDFGLQSQRYEDMVERVKPRTMV